MYRCGNDNEQSWGWYEIGGLGTIRLDWNEVLCGYVVR